MTPKECEAEASLKVVKVGGKVDHVARWNVASDLSRTEVEERFPGRRPALHPGERRAVGPDRPERRLRLPGQSRRVAGMNLPDPARTKYRNIDHCRSHKLDRSALVRTIIAARV